MMFNPSVKGRISIHAPSRERQMLLYKHPDIIFISIHAPSRERLLRRFDYSIYGHFNPRSLAGATCARLRL